MNAGNNAARRNVAMRFRQFRPNDHLSRNRSRSRCRENSEFAFAIRDRLPSAIVFGVLRASASARIEEANRTGEMRRVVPDRGHRNVGSSRANATRRDHPALQEPLVL